MKNKITVIAKSWLFPP